MFQRIASTRLCSSARRGDSRHLLAIRNLASAWREQGPVTMRESRERAMNVGSKSFVVTSSKSHTLPVRDVDDCDIPSQRSATRQSSVDEVLSPFQANEQNVLQSALGAAETLPTRPTRPDDIAHVDGLLDAGQMPTRPTISHHFPSGASNTSQQQPLPLIPSDEDWNLEGLCLTNVEVQNLFTEPSACYFKDSPLLFWVIIAIASRRYSRDLTLLTALSSSVPRLMWSTIQSVSQNYHDVKALCLLCTWPFPLSSSSRDATFMLGGTMLHLAMQIGLHVPGQAQDFSQFRLSPSPEEVQDRTITWTAVTVVSQTLSTSYGQPSITPSAIQAHPCHLKEDGPLNGLTNRLCIEHLCHRVTNSLQYMSQVEAVQRATPQGEAFDSLKQDMTRLESTLSNSTQLGTIDINQVYFLCAKLHLHLFSLFDSPARSDYVYNLKGLYGVCARLITLVSNSEAVTKYCPKYIFWMIIAAAFTIRKLLSSDFTDYLDLAATKQVFNTAVHTIREISVSNNDLAGRLAEVLVQLRARAYSQTLKSWTSDSTSKGRRGLDLKVRSRLSVSITYDSLWEWRNGFLISDTKDSEPNTPQFRSPSNGRDAAAHFRGNTISAVATPQNFELNDLIFDDLYPMNYTIEGAGVTDLGVNGYQ